MPLVNKQITHSKASFMAWLCCLPCELVTALACMVVCQCGKAAECACGPCLDDKLEDKAGAVASSAFSYMLEQAHAKLEALRTPQWDPTYLFSTGAMFDTLHATLYSQVRESITNIFNVSNFGVIRSEDLTEDELRSIGQQLRDAILSQLPSREDFYRDTQSKGIAGDNVNALNGYLAGLLFTIIGGDFIRNQLNRISDQVELRRAGNALVAAQAMAGMFGGMAAGLNANLENDAGQPLQQPPVYGAANRV